MNINIVFSAFISITSLAACNKEFLFFGIYISTQHMYIISTDREHTYLIQFQFLLIILNIPIYTHVFNGMLVLQILNTFLKF